MARRSYVGSDTAKRGLFMIALIMAAVVTVSMITMVTASAGESRSLTSDLSVTSEAPERSYTSVHIQEGDTLKTIASRYNDARYYSDEEYIETIKMINKMDHEQLHPGCYLVVMNVF